MMVGYKGFFYGMLTIIVIGLLMAMHPFRIEDQGPIVIELFTSQGCSSCPPADDILNELGKDPVWKGKIIPLAYHVDYWNYLGWKDKFSDHRWTERQGDYVKAMGGSTLYTPQAVVHGSVDVVGSKFPQVYAALKKQQKNSDAHRIHIRVESAEISKKMIRGYLMLNGEVPASLIPFSVVGVAYESDLTTEIRRGENAGRTLSNHYVVRETQKIQDLPAGLIGAMKIAFEIELSTPLFDAENGGVAFLVQHPETMEMIGAGAWNAF